MRREGADYVLTGALNLKTATRRSFFDSVRQAFPSEYGRIAALYRDREAYRAYKQRLYATVARLREKYDMPGFALSKSKPSPAQLTFF